MKKVSLKPYYLHLSMIVKDSEPVEMVQRSIDSVKDFVDDVYVTVTYTDSKPYTSELVKYLEQQQYHVSFFKWTYNFAEARNYAMDQVPKGFTHFLYWQDADDVLQNGQNLRKVTEDMVNGKTAAVFFNYLYMVELDENQQIKEVLVEHKRERIIRNDDTFRWIGALHETLIEQRQENIQKFVREDCAVVHLTNTGRTDVNIKRNIDILETQIKKENRKDPRTIIYLAKAYFDLSKDPHSAEKKKMYSDLALTLFREYLEGEGNPGELTYREGSGWAEERSTAWAYVSEIMWSYEKYKEALEAIDLALAEAPQFPMYYINKAMIYVMMRDIPKAKLWLMLATNIPEPKTTIISTPRDLKIKALETDYHIALTEGAFEKARKDVEMLVEIVPNIPEYKQRLDFITGMEMANKASQSIVFLGKYLESLKEQDKIPHLLRAIPKNLEVEKFVSEMKHQYMPIKTWEKNEITILCGPGWEPWTPDNVKTGLGGSEEAVVHMANELTKLGWKVTVYALPNEKAGNFNGVEYKQWYDLNPKDNFNVLILWRAIGFVDVNPQAKFTMLWLHDVPNNPDFTEERINKVDKIAVLSEYHKSLLRMQLENGEFSKIPESKIIVTANGINLVNPPAVKSYTGDPHKIIYMSSPDRGLVYLLTIWKKIREAVPDATLEVYYGFEIFDRMYANNPARQAWKETVLTMMKQPGITYHGRVGHKELEEGIAKCGIWAYPTDFTEISCISAMKAQALGAVPVVTDYAALKETVRNGLRIDADIHTPEGQEEYEKSLIELLKDPEQQQNIRENMIPWAREYFKWEKIAKDWSQLFARKAQA